MRDDEQQQQPVKEMEGGIPDRDDRPGEDFRW
jgi:hypothetical protein